MFQNITIIVDQSNQGLRLDGFLASHEDLQLSRTYIKKLIADGAVLVNNIVPKVSYSLSVGDTINLQIPEASVVEINPENIDLDIVFEDSDLLVINKASGMVTHPAPGNYSGTLVNALMYHLRKADGYDLSDMNGVLRPGIVHRLDKETSGLIVVAKNNFTHQALQAQIQSRICKRSYKALVCGHMKESQGTVSKPIDRDPKHRQRMAVIMNGRSAITHYKVLERYTIQNQKFTLVECRLETGRTHQIRVHMSYLKYPIVGDSLYNAPSKYPFPVQRFLLHAYKLEFIHPRSSEALSFVRDEDFSNFYS